MRQSQLAKITEIRKKRGDGRTRDLEAAMEVNLQNGWTIFGKGLNSGVCDLNDAIQFQLPKFISKDRVRLETTYPIPSSAYDNSPTRRSETHR